MGIKTQQVPYEFGFDPDDQHGPEYKKGFPYYSLQGEAESCHKHAIAKAITYILFLHLGRMHPIELRDIINALYSAVPTGSRKCNLAEYKGKIIQIHAGRGIVYEIEIDGICSGKET